MISLGAVGRDGPRSTAHCPRPTECDARTGNGMSMADDNTLRSYRANDGQRRGGRPSGPSDQPAGSDPLPELARLIGQSDPFADFGQKNPRSSERVATAPSSSGSDWRKTAAAMPAYDTHDDAPAVRGRAAARAGSRRPGRRDGAAGREDDRVTTTPRARRRSGLVTARHLDRLRHGRNRRRPWLPDLLFRDQRGEGATGHPRRTDTEQDRAGQRRSNEQVHPGPSRRPGPDRT